MRKFPAILCAFIVLSSCSRLNPPTVIVENDGSLKITVPPNEKYASLQFIDLMEEKPEGNRVIFTIESQEVRKNIGGATLWDVGQERILNLPEDMDQFHVTYDDHKKGNSLPEGNYLISLSYQNHKGTYTSFHYPSGKTVGF